MGLHKKVHGDGLDGRYLSVSPLLDGKVSVPNHRLPDGPMLPEMAYEIIHDELMLDGNARLNLATFVTTWMEPQAGKLMAEAYDVSSGMRERGWQVPAYSFPENREDLLALRVVRNGYSRDPADMFLDDLKRLPDAGFAH
jgi:glutamate/tyrosine decarboxylase-like PLP-dependent enzyme